MQQGVEWIRTAVGITVPKPQAPQWDEAASASQRQKLAAVANAQTIKVAQLEDKVSRIQVKLDDRIKAKDKPGAAPFLMQRNAANADLARMRGLLENTLGQLKVIEAAQMNLQQAKMTKDGADALASVNGEVDKIDITAAVDKMKDNVEKVKEQNKLLTQPIYSVSGSGLIDSYRASEELDALFAAEPMMPSVPAAEPVAAAATAAASAAAAERVHDNSSH